MRRSPGPALHRLGEPGGAEPPLPPTCRTCGACVRGPGPTGPLRAEATLT